MIKTKDNNKKSKYKSSMLLLMRKIIKQEFLMIMKNIKDGNK